MYARKSERIPRENEQKSYDEQAEGRSGKPGRSFQSRKCALLYRCPTCIRALCEAACQTASECGRQAGEEDAFGVTTGIFSSLQGLRPLRRKAAIPIEQE